MTFTLNMIHNDSLLAIVKLYVIIILIVILKLNLYGMLKLKLK